MAHKVEAAVANGVDLTTWNSRNQGRSIASLSRRRPDYDVVMLKSYDFDGEKSRP